MKMIKHLLVCLVLMLCSLAVFTGCDNSNSHAHTYSGEWTTDENYHWNNSSCGCADEISNKALHDWDEGVVTTPATCTTEGQKTYTCISCKRTKTEVIPVSDHTYSETWESNNDFHWHAATCIHNDLASGFGEHSWNEGVFTTPATCTAEGVKTFTCTVCGKTKTEAVPTVQHTYSTEWTSNESEHWHASTCGCDGLTKDKNTHSWNEGVITTPATCTTEGVKTFACDVCEYTKTETTPVLAHNYVNGECDSCDKTIYSQGLSYTLSDDKTYYIVSGIGTCEDVDIYIPETYNSLPVTSIGASAFKDCTNIKSINTGNILTDIGASAFSNCSGLVEISIGESVQSIGNWAFYKCSSVGTLYFNAIQMNDLPNKNYILSDFGSDTAVTIGNKVKRIPDYIFCPTTADRYYYTDITTISFESDSVCKEIGSGSFAFLEYLTSVTLPDTLEEIGSMAFWKCSALDTITIPQNVKTIGTGAFGCADFESILVNESNAYFKSVGGHLYSKDGKTFIQYANGGYSSTFTIPDGVETIGAQAFSYSSIRKLTLPDSLKSIENMAFGYCYSLSSLTIPKNVSKIAMCAFYGSYISSVTFKATDGWHSNGTYFDSTELANATTAATYLKTTYRDYAWYRW